MTVLLLVLKTELRAAGGTQVLADNSAMHTKAADVSAFGMVLFEIATDPPGFTVDEPVTLRLRLASGKTILAGSALAGSRSGRDHVQLIHVLPTAATASFRLRLRRSELPAGRGAVILVATAADGLASTLRITLFRG